MEDWESDSIVEEWLRENDDTIMSLPAIESNPHLLISKVRKHYMEYLIKLLSVNYESNQKLINKNIYLPSAIWRCAKMIEMSAAQASMVVQLYRKSITNVVKDLKNNTKKGLLYKELYECLAFAPENEKKTQTSLNKTNDCNCKCSCNQKRRIKKTDSPNNSQGIKNNTFPFKSHNLGYDHNLGIIALDSAQIQRDVCNTMYVQTDVCNTMYVQTDVSNIKDDTSPPKFNEKVTTEIQNSDELMQQLEKLFQDDPNDEDLFDGGLYEPDNSKVIEEEKQKPDTTNQLANVLNSQEVENNAPQVKCLDERLVLLSGVLVNNIENSQDSVNNKAKKSRTSKWLCEEYFQKVKLFELLDQIRDCDRNKLARIKEMLIELFGDDSDDEGVISPLEENPEFVISCKERITPWVVETLTPYYVKGRIRGKALFKSLAKHLIRLIYQCSKYPYEYEVQSFISDFINSHKMIRCEADFKQFRIENV